MKVDVSLADGNLLMLSALSETFERDGRFSLVSTTSTAEGFLQTVASVPGAVGVLDWGVPTLGAERVIRVLREQHAAPRIVVCAHGTVGEIPRRALAAGAAGFYSHAEPIERLLDAVAGVATGNMVFPYVDVRELHDPMQSLTRTERALLASLSTGLTNVELAAEHAISINTVKFHLRNLYEKLGVRNRAQAIASWYASREAGR